VKQKNHVIDSITVEPDLKRLKRKDSVEPLNGNSSPLPELPDELRKKQEEIDISSGHKRIPTPPKKCNQTKTSANLRGHRYASHASTNNQTYDQSVDDIIDSGLSDPEEILHVVRTHPNIGFFYMKTVAPRSSISYNPYKVK